MPEDCIIQGVILSNAIRTIDWRVRNIDYITTVPDNIITQVKARYKTILP